MLSQQQKPGTDSKSAQQCTVGGAPSTISPSYIGENTVVRAHGEGRQMRMTNVHFA